MTLRAGFDDDAIWQRMKNYVGTASLDAIVKLELKTLIDYEKDKKTKYNYPSAPFDIASTQYDKFQSCINRLKGTTFANDAEKIEEIMMELQNLFSLRKVKIHGKELQLKDLPDTATRGVPDKIPDIPTIIKKKYDLGKKYLEIHWDALKGKQFVVRIECVDTTVVIVRDNNSRLNTTIYNVMQEQRTPNNYYKFDVTDPLCRNKTSTVYDDSTVTTKTTSHTFRVKVTVQTGEDNITEDQWKAMKGQIIDFPDENRTINKYRMNPSNSLYPVDKFRLEICNKYKTIYDLFALAPETEGQNFINSCATIYRKLLELRLDTQVVPWEYLKIPIRWNTLSYGQKVLVILQKAIPNNLFDFMKAKVANLYYADIINKPYAIDPAKGGSQRVTGAKRPYHALSTIPTQMEYEFANKGKQREAVRVRDIIENSTWKESQKYFKKNSVVYGKEFHEFIYLDTRLEREACDTLRRVDRLLRLSKERGYPVLNKNVAAPYNYSSNTSTHRDTTFGVNNYDRTQSYPPLQPAPLIMAIEGDGGSSTITVEDTQPPFDRRDMVKKTKLVTVLKASTDNGDIYYNHPLYRSQQKKNSDLAIQRYRGPPLAPPLAPPGPPGPPGPPRPPRPTQRRRGRQKRPQTGQRRRLTREEYNKKQERLEELEKEKLETEKAQLQNQKEAPEDIIEEAIGLGKYLKSKEFEKMQKIEKEINKLRIELENNEGIKKLMKEREKLRINNVKAAEMFYNRQSSLAERIKSAKNNNQKKKLIRQFERLKQNEYTKRRETMKKDYNIEKKIEEARKQDEVEQGRLY